MWKPGQLVTIDNLRYRVTKCAEETKVDTCTVCNYINSFPPCLRAAESRVVVKGVPSHTLVQGRTWCTRKMPLNCYPKQLSSSSKSTASK